MAKRAGRKGPAPPVVVKSDGFITVYFSREVIEERETLRRLAHRAVDLRVERGRDEWLHESVSRSLAYVARDDVIKTATDLVHEVLAEGKDSRRG